MAARMLEPPSKSFPCCLGKYRGHTRVGHWPLAVTVFRLSQVGVSCVVVEAPVFAFGGGVREDWSRILVILQSPLLLCLLPRGAQGKYVARSEPLVFPGRLAILAPK